MWVFAGRPPGDRRCGVSVWAPECQIGLTIALSTGSTQVISAWLGEHVHTVDDATDVIVIVAGLAAELIAAEAGGVLVEVSPMVDGHDQAEVDAAVIVSMLLNSDQVGLVGYVLGIVDRDGDGRALGVATSALCGMVSRMMRHGVGDVVELEEVG